VTPASRRILVVDDNPDVAHSFALLLEIIGNTVMTAPDGPTALTLVRDFKPEVIFLDIGLPGMDGYEVARHLRQEYGCGKFKLFALSGYGRDEDKQRSQQAGFDLHLVKPVDFDIIEELLANLS
jgi:CheY-like chemotaxis protein